jgi:hypothetical protein
MNKLIILIIVIFIISLIYILKFKETFQQCPVSPITEIDPRHPNCVSKCIHDYTWTIENRSNIAKILGNIKDDVTPAHLRTSNCYKCMRNFYHGIKKIRDNTCS